MHEEQFFLDRIEQAVPTDKETIMAAFYEFLELEHLYESAAEIVKTQLNIYDNEFSFKFQRNPIHGIESRIKSPQSIVEKLQRKGFPLSAKSARQNLMDIAGIRVVCYYVQDIYALAELLHLQETFQVVKVKDYIKHPKPSGYRSLHMILTVPVRLAGGRQLVPVEIQIRTIAMDFWASLEHQLHYKTDCVVSDALKEELRDCAETIAQTDLQMQDIYQRIHDLD
ncbi:MAG: GTP pyrophosphokinase family protein [Oscillospiraceae bacterium]|nr:GTP pyrophosphokinase family protein [Oscillospiraceae bacterium]